jgi:hypothetical protein
MASSSTAELATVNDSMKYILPVMNKVLKWMVPEQRHSAIEFVLASITRAFGDVNLRKGRLSGFQSAFMTKSLINIVDWVRRTLEEIHTWYLQQPSFTESDRAPRDAGLINVLLALNTANGNQAALRIIDSCMADMPIGDAVVIVVERLVLSLPTTSTTTNPIRVEEYYAYHNRSLRLLRHPPQPLPTEKTIRYHRGWPITTFHHIEESWQISSSVALH